MNLKYSQQIILVSCEIIVAYYYWHSFWYEIYLLGLVVIQYMYRKQFFIFQVKTTKMDQISQISQIS